MLETYNHIDAFYKAAHLDESNRRWRKSRRTPSLFADVLIVDTHPGYWYEPFIGTQVFAELDFRDWGHGEFLYDVTVVYLTGTYVTHGRTIDPKHIMIL